MTSRLLFALAILCALAVDASAGIELEIHGTPAGDDDYLCWSPTLARIRLVGEAANRNVTLQSSQRATGGDQGEVWFQAVGAAAPNWTTFTPVDSLPLTLPATGAWKEFWIAGKQSSGGSKLPDGTAVTDGKDTLVLVKDAASNAQLHQHPVMVRIRKDAEKLSADEIQRFLQAVATLHDVPNIGLPGHNSLYLKYVKVHGDAFFGGIHNVPAFAPWHRTMLLAFERDLQSIDPRVALPYWKFDDLADDLFTPTFIGVVSAPSPIVNFDATNPIRNWRMPSNSAIAAWSQGDPAPPSTEQLRRNQNGSTSMPVVNLTTVLNSPNYSVMNTRLEGSYHNQAHNHISGWLGSVTSPKDPLFFLLHANVDRAWLLWQRKTSSFDRADASHFFPQGTYVPGSFHHGSFAGDEQWPWNLAGGDLGMPGSGDDWPEFTFPLPGAFNGHGPSAKPITGEAVDFINSLGSGPVHNYSYDSAPYHK